MEKNKFLLLSLDDDRAKKIATAVSNSSCKKIVEFLSENESATETELSNKLSIPLSTVHYNLEQLKNAGLIEWNSYHYSQKGKEVKHYSLANKYIVIAPKNDHSFFEKLKNFLPAIGISVIGAISIGWFSYPSQKHNELSSIHTLSRDSIQQESTQNVINVSSSLWYEPSIWFLLGGIISIFTLYFWFKLKK